MTIDMNVDQNTYEDVVRENNAPLLDPGVYLAGMVSVEPYIGKEAMKELNGVRTMVRSYNLLTTFRINTNPDAITLGWDISDKPFEMTNQYIWLTHLYADKDVRHPDATFSRNYFDLRRAYGMADGEFNIDPANLVGRLVRVRIEHEDDEWKSEQEGVAGLKRARIGRILEYLDPKTGEKAPVYEPLLRAKSTSNSQF